MRNAYWFSHWSGQLKVICMHALQLPLRPLFICVRGEMKAIDSVLRVAVENKVTPFLLQYICLQMTYKHIIFSFPSLLWNEVV